MQGARGKPEGSLGLRVEREGPGCLAVTQRASQARPTCSCCDRA